MTTKSKAWGLVAVDITEVRIKLMEESEDRLRAFCSITFDNCFVVRDLKIIEGSHGPFVAMPSRKLTNRCQRCGNKNHIRSNYCNNCGSRVRDSRDHKEEDLPNKLYADVAHPINSECREMIQNAVLDEFSAELQRAAQPGYRSRYDDEFDDDVEAVSTYLRDDGAIEPNRPHFADSPAPEKETIVSEDDGFGQGIF